VLRLTGLGRIFALGGWKGRVYTLYLDGSGSHGTSPIFILAGIAIHEQDAYHLQQRFAAPLSRLPDSVDPRDYELHATEIKSRGKPSSMWHSIPHATRMGILGAAFRALATYECIDSEKYPYAYFGAVVERSYADYEERAWEEVLHRFDEMLTRYAHETGEHQRGIVIHDRSVTEREVQDWADRWRLLSGRIGVLTHMTDVPFFADSKASRLLQAADFIAWALWRQYGLPSADSRWINPLWARFDQRDGTMHGLVHVTRSFASGGCSCPPCASRGPGVEAVTPAPADSN
jgi:hypothetical protein